MKRAILTGATGAVGIALIKELVSHDVEVLVFCRESSKRNAQIPEHIFIGELLEQGKMFVKVLKTNDTWYGMTYHEDVAAVKDSFKKMLADGVYKADLFTDL